MSDDGYDGSETESPWVSFHSVLNTRGGQVIVTDETTMRESEGQATANMILNLLKKPDEVLTLVSSENLVLVPVRHIRSVEFVMLLLDD